MPNIEDFYPDLDLGGIKERGLKRLLKNHKRIVIILGVFILYFLFASFVYINKQAAKENISVLSYTSKAIAQTIDPITKLFTSSTTSQSTSQIPTVCALITEIQGEDRIAEEAPCPHGPVQSCLDPLSLSIGALCGIPPNYEGEGITIIQNPPKVCYTVSQLGPIRTFFPRTCDGSETTNCLIAPVSCYIGGGSKIYRLTKTDEEPQVIELPRIGEEDDDSIPLVPPCIPFVNCDLFGQQQDSPQYCPPGTYELNNFCYESSSGKKIGEILEVELQPDIQNIAPNQTLTIGHNRNYRPKYLDYTYYEPENDIWSKIKDFFRDKSYCYGKKITRGAFWTVVSAKDRNPIRNIGIFWTDVGPLSPQDQYFIATRFAYVFQDFLNFSASGWNPGFVCLEYNSMNNHIAYYQPNSHVMGFTPLFVLESENERAQTLMHEMTHFYDSNYYRLAKQDARLAEGRGTTAGFIYTGGRPDRAFEYWQNPPPSDRIKPYFQGFQLGRIKLMQAIQKSGGRVASDVISLRNFIRNQRFDYVQSLFTSVIAYPWSQSDLQIVEVPGTYADAIIDPNAPPSTPQSQAEACLKIKDCIDFCKDSSNQKNPFQVESCKLVLEQVEDIKKVPTGSSQTSSTSNICIYPEQKTGDILRCYSGTLKGANCEFEAGFSTELGKGCTNARICKYSQGNNCYIGRCTSEECTTNSFNVRCEYDSGLGQKVDCPNTTQTTTQLSTLPQTSSTGIKRVEVYVQEYPEIKKELTTIPINGPVETDLNLEGVPQGADITICAAYIYQDNTQKSECTPNSYKYSP